MYIYIIYVYILYMQGPFIGDQCVAKSVTSVAIHYTAMMCISCCSAG